MKEATVQIRMDSDVKKEVEKLYKSLGTSFAEAVRVFASQSIKERGYPFIPRAYNNKSKSARGMLNKKASEELRKKEKDALMSAVVKKHE